MVRNSCLVFSSRYGEYLLKFQTTLTDCSPSLVQQHSLFDRVSKLTESMAPERPISRPVMAAPVKGAFDGVADFYTMECLTPRPVQQGNPPNPSQFSDVLYHFTAKEWEELTGNPPSKRGPYSSSPSNDKFMIQSLIYGDPVEGHFKEERKHDGGVEPNSNQLHTPRHWDAVQTPYGLTPLEHIQLSALLAPQGSKAVSKEACEAMAAVGRIESKSAFLYSDDCMLIRLVDGHWDHDKTINQREPRFSAQIRHDLGQPRKFPMRCPPMRKHGAFHWFDNKQTSKDADDELGIGKPCNCCVPPAEREHSAAYQKFQKDFNHAEAQCVIRIRRWFDEALTPVCKTADSYKDQLNPLPVGSIPTWEEADDTIKQMALIRMSEIIHRCS